MSQEEMELQGKRRNEVEKMLAKRDQAYEELLGASTVTLNAAPLTRG